MNYPYSVRDYQIRVNSLRVPGSTVIKVDGMNGPNTKKQIQLAMKHQGISVQSELMHESGINRIHWHWTASGYKVNWDIRRHYNAVFDKDGNKYDGGAPYQAQALYQPGRVGVSHTYMANTGALGLAVAAMAGATTSGDQVNQGSAPLNWEMIDAMLEETAMLCKYFDIRVSPWTTLTHAEVGTNINIKQRGKWDIRCFPDNPTHLYSELEAGNMLRERLVEKFM